MLGLTVMGIAAPTVLDMSLSPIIAQKRSNNFGVAETSAVTFAAANEGAASVGTPPTGCTLDSTNKPAYRITCEQGSGKYIQRVTRAFRTNQNASPARTFPHTVSKPSMDHQCNAPDEWGIGWADKWPTLKQCMPQVAWSKEAYLNSDPDYWLYDINNIRGFGPHPDY